MIRYFTIFSVIAFNSYMSLFAPPKTDPKRGKESELAWMGIAYIGSTVCAHPALRQRIL